jgi:hypothetical protein
MRRWFRRRATDRHGRHARWNPTTDRCCVEEGDMTFDGTDVDAEEL